MPRVSSFDQSAVSALLGGDGVLAITLDTEGRILRCNAAFEHAAAGLGDGFVGRSFAELLASAGSVKQLESILLGSGDTSARFRSGLAVDGSEREFLWKASRIVKSKQEAAWAVLGVEITDLVKIETTLEESLERHASILASAMDAIISIDSEQRITIFNAAAEKMFLCKAEEALGKPVSRFIPHRFRGVHEGHINAFGEANVTARTMGSLGSLWGLRSNGEEFQIEASISQTGSGAGKLYTVIIRDISLRIQSEERLREQAALLNHAQEAILVRDLDHRLLFWNKGAERLYGWNAEEVLGRKSTEIFRYEETARFAEAVDQVLKTGEWSGELTQHTRDGKRVFVEGRWTLVRDDAGLPKSVLVINTDISERKKLEAQFLRAQRMESIGTLAGGIAHDLNNVLAPIIMAMNLLRLRFKDEESQRVLSVLQTNAERGADMVKQVLSFARGIEGERISLQPKHLIREIVKILKDTLPKSIEIKFFIPDTVWPVLGDATQLHQVLMNLSVNARDAMPSGGELRIEVENTAVDENYAQTQFDARPGNFVLINVTDTGGGIAPEIINNIFDPFFTTKDFGKGTGLGLSTVLGIVKSHGGFVTVYSEFGRGTAFKVYLPADPAATAAQVKAEQESIRFGNGELILIVDDEAAIRDITRGTLEAYGYRAITASDGTEAIAAYAQKRDEIRIVLTDMMMPFLDGPATIRALQKMNPNVRVIAASGLADNEKLVDASKTGVQAFLTKPFNADQLLRTIADVLDRQ
ncbi:MAG: hybrid sensor histidine kinase/response regulator [Blastocatellia bacterium AA13]|nr:MAG: hybrid sensor histidine kinase/response regulator [Blastocatellia bacterium AA13]